MYFENIRNTIVWEYCPGVRSGYFEKKRFQLNPRSYRLSGS